MVPSQIPVGARDTQTELIGFEPRLSNTVNQHVPKVKLINRIEYECVSQWLKMARVPHEWIVLPRTQVVCGPQIVDRAYFIREVPQFAEAGKGEQELQNHVRRADHTSNDMFQMLR